MIEVVLAWIGTLASIFGAAVAIQQAKAARTARDEVTYASQQLRVAECARWLEHALRSASPLLNTGEKARGRDPHEVLERVQHEFDQAFLALPSSQEFAELRTQMTSASGILTTTRRNIGTGHESAEELCERLRTLAQRARSMVRPSSS